MKRGIFDVLRRGLDNAVANWGLIVVRIVETIVMVALTVMSVLLLVVPVLVSIGIRLTDIASPEDIENIYVTLIERWMLFVWIFLGATVLTLMLVAIHAFVTAGCARVYVDGERSAGPANLGPRIRYKVFSTERWLGGARDGWWTVFWIYNLAWGVAGLVLLLPLIPTLVMTLVFRESPAVAITSGCIGLVITLMLGILVGIVTGMWTNRAIGDWAARRTGASASLSTAWQAIKRDLGRHLLLAIAMIIIGIAGSSFFASFSLLAGFGQTMHDASMAELVFAPFRMAGSVLSMIFSAFVTSWTLASYVSLAEEGR